MVQIFGIFGLRISPHHYIPFGEGFEDLGHLKNRFSSIWQKCRQCIFKRRTLKIMKIVTLSQSRLYSERVRGERKREKRRLLIIKSLKM